MSYRQSELNRQAILDHLHAYPLKSANQIAIDAGLSRNGVQSCVVGECHHRAKLSDFQVYEMRQLRERNGKSYGVLAQIFGCSPWTVRDICKYWTRPLP